MLRDSRPAKFGSGGARLGPWGLPWSWLAGALLLHLLPFATRPALIGGDEPHYALLAHSLASDCDLELSDDYAAVEEGSAAAGRKRAGQGLDRHLREYEGRFLPAHPAGVPALLAPLLAAQMAIAPAAAPDLIIGLAGLALTFAALVSGARLLGLWLADPLTGAVAAFAAYFCSPLWFHSRTFFTEPYTWSLAVLSIAATSAGRLFLGSVLLGLTLVTKESALLLVVVVLAGVAACLGLRRAAVLAMGPATTGTLWVVSNVARGLPPFLTSQPFQAGDLLDGARGLFLAADRGLIWFAPLLVAGTAAWLASAAGDALRQRHRPAQVCARGATEPTPGIADDAPGPDRFARESTAGPEHRFLPLFAVLALAAYFSLAAAWIDWRGGSGFGPRLLLPGLPGLALPLASVIRTGRRALRLFLAALGVAGFTVGWCAALDPVGAFWDPTVLSLVTARPAVTAAGLALATWIALRVLRLLPFTRPATTWAATTSGEARIRKLEP
ncbi:MAG: hypothetical protein M5U13_04780 [Thermoanaerobaculia bacterium]|nr:hypothetical protein [Thermoanaerobaculia bacterium]